jgi:hypothetical protein
MRAEGKRHAAALLCLARRRIDVLFAMISTRTSYRPPTVSSSDSVVAADSEIETLKFDEPSKLESRFSRCGCCWKAGSYKRRGASGCMFQK